MSTSTQPRGPRGLVALSRAQSPGEELANSLSHGAGLVAALTGAPVLIVAAVQQRHVGMIVGASVFSAAMIVAYLCSTLYHALPEGRAKRVFRVLDHVSIFLLIAGTYTPFTLGVLEGAWGWSVFGVIWLLALAGTVMKFTGGLRKPWLSTGLYLLMGWLVLVAIHPLWLRMPVSGLIWLAAGGVAYTLGVPFFARDERIRYAHAVWHLFVLTGTICHFAAVFASV